MTYLSLNVPVGSYNPDRIANLGIGHAAIDWGAAYTYLDPDSGWEFSALAGLTYNWENPYTDYQNGIDSHLDWGASRWVNKTWELGVAGYVYYQLTDDSGAGDEVGGNRSRIAAIGPQIGYQQHGRPPASTCHCAATRNSGLRTGPRDSRCFSKPATAGSSSDDGGLN